MSWRVGLCAQFARVMDRLLATMPTTGPAVPAPAGETNPPEPLNTSEQD